MTHAREEDGPVVRAVLERPGSLAWTPHLVLGLYALQLLDRWLLSC